MNCPYCNKEINAFTGLQELQKFQKHLMKCKKYNSKIVLAPDEDAPLSDKSLAEPQGTFEVAKPHDLMTALNIRAESGQ